MRALITGASGQVGRALLQATPGHTELHAFTRQQLDISDAAAVRAAIQSLQPDLVINAAAYTAVDRAESEPGRAAAVNAQGSRNLAEAVRAIPACRLLHISTDYVFDGRRSAPYQPSDPTNPLSVYGRTKLLGEQAVAEVLAERAAVLRTAWVYGPSGRNFMLTMLQLMRERGVVQVVADQRGTPTAASSIARALWRLAALPRVDGIVHWTDEGVASWYDFACAIAEEAASAGLLAQPVRVVPITTAEYPTPAHRPSNSVLDQRDSIERLGINPVPWRESLVATLRALADRQGGQRP